MTITTRDGIINALGNSKSKAVINKASVANAAAQQWFSLWRATGLPAQPGFPATTAVITNSATTGALPFVNQTAPATSYLALAALNCGNAGSNIEIHDRLAHMGSLSGIVTTAQTVNLSLLTLGVPAARIGRSDYSEVQWWLEIFADLGATGVNATVAVEYDDGSTGNLAAIALGATPRLGRLYPLIPAVAGRYIRAVTSVTLSATTGTAGNFGIVATRQRFSGDLPVANKTEVFDWARTGFPDIPNDSCLTLLMLCSTTSTGAVNGSITLAQG